MDKKQLINFVQLYFETSIHDSGEEEDINFTELDDAGIDTELSEQKTLELINKAKIVDYLVNNHILRMWLQETGKKGIAEQNITTFKEGGFLRLNKNIKVLRDGKRSGSFVLHI